MRHLITLCCLVSYVLCYNLDEIFPGQQVENGIFQNPVGGQTAPSDYPHNIVYNAGETLNVSWQTNMDPLDVLVCQPLTNGAYTYTRLARNVSISSLPWQVPFASTSNDTIGPMFYLAVFLSGSNDEYFTSHFFNISNDAKTTASTTASMSLSVLAPTSTTSGASVASASSSAPASDTTASEPKSGLSTGAVAGISVSVTAVVIIAAVAGGYMFWKKRTGRNQARGVANTGWDQVAYSGDTQYASLQQQPYVAQLDGTVTNELGPSLPHEIGGKEVSSKYTQVQNGG